MFAIPLIQALVLLGIVSIPWLDHQSARCTAELGRPAVYLPADGGCK